MKEKYYYILVFVCGFTIYMFWSIYWIALCWSAVAEECIAGRWMLLISGLPSTVVTWGIGRVGIFELLLTGVIGGAQWGGLLTLIVWALGKWYRSSRE